MKLFFAMLMLSLAMGSPNGSDDKARRPAAPLSGTPVMEVLFPSTDPGRGDYDDVQKYLLNKSSRAFPYISGAVIKVDWSDFDIGDSKSGTHTKYDFKVIDEAIAPWINAGKYANLVMHTSPYGGTQCPPRGIGSNGEGGIGNCAMPPWMWTALGDSGYADCDGARAPNYFLSAFQTNYQNAIAALVKHYEDNPGVGYLRIGLGKGGEINLPRGWHDPSNACGALFVKRWGYTIGNSNKYTWNAYLEKMLEFEGSLHSKKQLMVSITPVQSPGVNPQEVSDFIAPIAVKYGIGFGNQGLSAQAMRDCTGMQADWCNLFERFQGKVPLELQTLGPSCPSGSECEGQGGGGQGQSGGGRGRWGQGQGQSQGQGGWGQRRGGWGQGQGQGQGGHGPGGGGGASLGKLSSMTGPLAPLLPFAIKNHVTIIELYTVDWLIAFNPNHPQNAQAGSDYAQAIGQAAEGR